jgi:hypothetical protein
MINTTLPDGVFLFDKRATDGRKGCETKKYEE